MTPMIHSTEEWIEHKWHPKCQTNTFHKYHRNAQSSTYQPSGGSGIVHSTRGRMARTDRIACESDYDDYVEQTSRPWRQ